MRTPNTSDYRSDSIVRIIPAQNLASRVLVDGVAQRRIAEVREGEERGDVGVVHEEGGAVAVDFVGVYFAIGGVRNYSVLFYAAIDGRTQGLHACC